MKFQQSKRIRQVFIEKNEWLLPQLTSGAIIGPLCDNFHSQYEVLQYERFQITVGDFFETAIWVPPLFALAAIIIGSLALVLDDETPNDVQRLPLFAIFAFIAHYWLSGILSQEINAFEESSILWPLAFLLYYFFDRRPSTFIAGIVTAISGPLIELGLTHFGGLYHYITPDFLSLVPSWIPAVYFAGTPAVAQLARYCIILFLHHLPPL